MFLRSHRFRRGVTLVEGAIVCPLALMFTLGLVVFGLGSYRYQQVAALAREGARYASVHGGQWAKENNNNTLTTSTNIYNNAIKPNAAGLNLNDLSLSSVTYSYNDQMPTDPFNTSRQTNIVTVTVTYTWAPEAYLGSTLTLTSTSRMPISY
jgi:Flp pilus assembly protein TadG